VLKIAAIILIFLGVGRVSAASFDCTKAETPFEKTICSTPDLSVLDERLSVAYRTALGGLSDGAKKEMVEGQRVWLDFARHECSPFAELPTLAYDEGGSHCLIQSLRRRISVFENNRMLGGYRFYNFDDYSYAPDHSSPMWATVATRTRNSTRIDGEGEISKNFNIFISQYEDRHFRPRNQATALDRGKEAEQLEGMSSSVNLHPIDIFQKRHLMLQKTDWYYGHGAVHGQYFISYIHYLLDEPRELTANDVFSGKDWEDILANLVKIEVKKYMKAIDYDCCLDLDDADKIKDITSDTGRWKFSDAGLGIQFNPYEIGPYSEGAPLIFVPWFELRDNLPNGSSWR